MDPRWFKHAKQVVIEGTGLNQDALHVYVGLLLLLGVGWALRRPLGAGLPLFVVLAVALAGESYDLRFDLYTLGHWQWSDSLHDVLNTMFWPTTLVVLARCGMLRLK